MSPMPALQPTPDPYQEALQWLRLLQQPNCDAAQREAFAAWCLEPRNAQAYNQLQATLQAAVIRPRPVVSEVRQRHVGKYLGALFLLILAALVYLYWPWMQRLTSDVHSNTGERRTLRLADGSSVHLDSASAVNVDLRGRTRHLQLVQGQMSLEVVLDGRALEVQVDEARIQVFGTRLVVARNADHDALTVLSGKAMIVQGGDQRLVSAGEHVTFGDAGIDTVEKADIRNVEAWRQGQWVAKDMPLSHVLQRLASYQGQRVWLMDEQIAYRRVNGTFNLDRPAETLARLASDQHLQIHSVPGLYLLVR